MVGHGKPKPLQLDRAVLLCRAEGKLSLEAMAQAVGLSKGGLCNIERGLSRPRRTTRLRLVEFLRARGYRVAGEEAA